jgi:hypothetical protein
LPRFRPDEWRSARPRLPSPPLAARGPRLQAIVEALLAGDSKAAARAMSAHIRSGVKYWTRALPATRGAGVSPAKNNSSNGKRLPKHKSRFPNA